MAGKKASGFETTCGNTSAGSMNAAGAQKTDPRGTPGKGDNVREHMDVICSCGSKLGVVDRVEGNSIKLTKNDSPDGQHHRIPFNWIDHVDNHVHLTKNSEEAMQQWQPA
jgi:hypothetical protein